MKNPLRAQPNLLTFPSETLQMNMITPESTKLVSQWQTRLITSLM